jgi:tetratricopeptide (TPR) repeat protein
MMAGAALLPVPAKAQAEPEKSVLAQAWDEYSFLEFRKARKLFDSVIANPPNREDLCQALVGRAFCYQFGGRGNIVVADYQEALAAYARCRQELGEDHRLAPFWMAMSAECHCRIYMLNKDATQIAEAEKLWQRLQRDHHSSVFAQDALLFRAAVGMMAFDDEKTTARLQEVEAYVASQKKGGGDPSGSSNLLAPVMANYLAECYFWREDYGESVRWYREYCRLGPTSFRERNAAWFRLARIADTKLNDRDTAIEFYTKVWKEAASDGKVYFCSERVRELMAGEK